MQLALLLCLAYWLLPSASVICTACLMLRWFGCRSCWCSGAQELAATLVTMNTRMLAEARGAPHVLDVDAYEPLLLLMRQCVAGALAATALQQLAQTATPCLPPAVVYRLTAASAIAVEALPQLLQATGQAVRRMQQSLPPSLTERLAAGYGKEAAIAVGIGAVTAAVLLRFAHGMGSTAPYQPQAATLLRNTTAKPERLVHALGLLAEALDGDVGHVPGVAHVQVLPQSDCMLLPPHLPATEPLWSTCTCPGMQCACFTAWLTAACMALSPAAEAFCETEAWSDFMELCSLLLGAGPAAACTRREQALLAEQPQLCSRLARMSAGGRFQAWEGAKTLRAACMLLCWLAPGRYQGTSP